MNFYSDVLNNNLTGIQNNKADKAALGSVKNESRTVSVTAGGDSIQEFSVPTPGTYIIFASLCSYGTGGKGGLLSFEYNGGSNMTVYHQGSSYEDNVGNGYRGLYNLSPVVTNAANATIKYRIYNTNAGTYTLRFTAIRLK